MTARLWSALEDQPLDRSAIAHQPLTMDTARLLSTHPTRMHQRIFVAVGLDQILLIEDS